MPARANQILQQINQLNNILASKGCFECLPVSFSEWREQVHSVRRNLEELRKEEERLNLVIQCTGVGIWDWYVQTGETVFNERWANIIGYTLEEIAPVSIQSWLNFAHPDDLVESERRLHDLWEGKADYYLFESRMKHKNGDWIWVLDTGQVVEWEEPGKPRRMIGTHVDITEQKLAGEKLLKAKQETEEALQQLGEAHLKLQSEIAQRNQAEDRITQLSQQDILTNLPNRLRFYLDAEKLERKAEADQQGVAVILVHIRDLKQINDKQGYDAGDAVIVEVALQLSEMAAANERLYRLVGDIFMLVADGVNGIEGLSRRAARMLENLDQPLDTIGNDRLPFSIGAALYPSHAGDLRATLDAANHALARAGRNDFTLFAPAS